MSSEPPAPVGRLTIHITAATRADLAWLVEHLPYNRTTAMNRAVQVYTNLEQVRAAGGRVLIQEADGTVREVKWL